MNGVFAALDLMIMLFGILALGLLLWLIISGLIDYWMEKNK